MKRKWSLLLQCYLRDKRQCNVSPLACSVPKFDEGQLQDDCQSLNELQNSDADFISSSSSALMT